MKVTGLSGHVWAWLGPAETVAMSANRAHRMVFGFTAFSSGYCKWMAAVGSAMVCFAAPVPVLNAEEAAQRRLTVCKMPCAIHQNEPSEACRRRDV
jgi:hypothetical protein